MDTPHVIALLIQNALIIAIGLYMVLGPLRETRKQSDLLERENLMVDARHRAENLMVAAERRAENLMRESLTEAELDSLAISGYVEVPSGLKPGNAYRVYRNPAERRTEEWRDGRVLSSYCLLVVPEEYAPGAITGMGLPTGDILVAQVLLLKADERRYLLNANRFDTRGGCAVTAMEGRPCAEDQPDGGLASAVTINATYFQPPRVEVEWAAPETPQAHVDG